jgi:uncharacterized protein (DUF2225 family)
MLYLLTIYVYCVFLAMQKDFKTLAKLSDENRNYRRSNSLQWSSM